MDKKGMTGEDAWMLLMSVIQDVVLGILIAMAIMMPMVSEAATDMRARPTVNERFAASKIASDCKVPQHYASRRVVMFAYLAVVNLVREPAQYGALDAYMVDMRWLLNMVNSENNGIVIDCVEYGIRNAYYQQGARL